MKLQEKDFERTERATDKTAGFFLDARTTSWLVAAGLALLFFSFFTGYFLGQKQAIARFTHKLDQDSFADHIYAALCGMDDAQEQATTGDQTATDDDAIRVSAADEQQGQSNTSIQSATQEESDEQEPADAPTPGAANKTANAEEPQSSEQEISTQYYAQLAGFGTAKAAQRLVYRLHQKGIPVFVRKRNSRSARGTLISWYQVVTERFQDKTKLEELITTIKKEEKITDVHLVSC